MDQQLRDEIFSQLGIIVNGDAGDIATAIQRLDELKASTDGHLQHYLQNRSYQKAWKLLNSGSAPQAD